MPSAPRISGRSQGSRPSLGKRRESRNSNIPYPDPKAGQRSTSAPTTEITFGVEMEFIMCIKKETEKGLEEAEMFDLATSLLNAQPALANQVRNCRVPVTFLNYHDHWNLIVDHSIIIYPDSGAMLYDVPTEDANCNHSCYGMELVSPIFKYSNIDNFARKLTAVNTAMKGVAYNNTTTGLHVHLGIPIISDDPVKSGITFEVLNLIHLLWAASEPVIESLMPRYRHGKRNSHCGTLFSKIIEDFPDKTQHRDKLITLAKKLQECTSDVEIFTHIGDDIEERQKKICISFQTMNKMITVEFREHFGTFSRPDIVKWVGFCRKMLLFCYENRNKTWTNDWLNNLFNQTQTFEQLVAFVGIDDRDAEFFRNRQQRIAAGDYPVVMCCR